MAIAGQDRIWQVGEVATMRVEYRNSSEALADPTTVTFKVRAPGGTISTYTYAAAQVTKSATGIYTKDITVDADGKWILGHVATGAVATAGHETITVEDDPFS